MAATAECQQHGGWGIDTSQTLDHLKAMAAHFAADLHTRVLPADVTPVYACSMSMVVMNQKHMQSDSNTSQQWR